VTIAREELRPEFLRGGAAWAKLFAASEEAEAAKTDPYVVAYSFGLENIFPGAVTLDDYGCPASNLS
jgi:hypothetical protein